MSTEDWKLVLDFTKALAAPVMTLVAALVVARLGLGSYRAQRALDRRLTWQDRYHELLGRAPNVWTWAANAHESGAQERSRQRLEEAMQLSGTIAEKSAEAFLYASEEAMIAIRRLGLQLEEHHRSVEAEGHVTRTIAVAVARDCYVAANNIATDYRRQLGQPPLDLYRIDRLALPNK